MNVGKSVLLKHPIIMRGFLKDLKGSLSRDEYEYFLKEGTDAIDYNNDNDFVKSLVGKRVNYLQSYRFDHPELHKKAYRIKYENYDILIWDRESKEIGIEISDELFEL